MPELFDNSAIERDALIVGDFRYWLTRQWADGPTLLYVMLNPSTADGRKDDNTIKRCTGFAKDHGFTRYVVVNLYAFRSTYPEDVFKAQDAVGPLNDYHIAMEAYKAKLIVCAWGSIANPDRVDQVKRILTAKGQQLYCLGLTQQGHPRHPLYVPKAQKFEVYA